MELSLDLVVARRNPLGRRPGDWLLVRTSMPLSPGQNANIEAHLRRVGGPQVEILIDDSDATYEVLCRE